MHVYIIAEIGVNHNGDVNIAEKLIDEAKDVGADCVKFQTFVTENLVTKTAEAADYQKVNMQADISQYEMLKKLELSFDNFKYLKNYCTCKAIDFMSTAFDSESISLLDAIGMDVWKIPSGEITNLPYLKQIAYLQKRVILSTGMSTMAEVKSAIDILKAEGTKDIVLLHATTEYPAPFEDVNLKAMKTMADAFGLPVGYSDHTKGSEVAIAAAALGAVVIEKHFTLDCNMEGPDHKASLDVDGMRCLIKAVRHIESALGDGVKAPTDGEIPNMKAARKSIIAKRDIKKGEVFDADNLGTKRPGNGVSPMLWYDVVGKPASRDYMKDEQIDR